MSIRERIPIRHDLFEYAKEVVIEKKGIDHNVHLNHKGYFAICEAQRDLFIKDCGIDSEAIRRTLGLRMVVARDGTFDFKRQVFEGDKISVYTSAEVVLAHLRFNQRMVREGVDVFNLQCKIAVINVTGEPQRLPDEIKDKINQANLTKQTKQ